MKKINHLLTTLILFINVSINAQVVTLSGTQYVETFDGIGAGLPNGWTTKTGAAANALGTDVAFTTTAGLWNVTSGRFYNFASADIGETGDQAAATDRALGIRQTGTFGDPGGAFVVKLANTTNLNAFNLSFKLQSLDKTSVRLVTWGVDYAIGDSTNFTTLNTGVAPLQTGGSTFTNQNINASFGNALDNESGNIWIRIRTTTASTGSGNRPSSAIDDFTLTYTNGGGSNTPTIAASPSSLTFANTEGVTAEVKNYTLQGSSLTNDIKVTAPTNFEISNSNNTGFTNTLTFTQTSGNVTPKTIYVRMQNTTKGTFNGNITHTSTGATSQNVAVSGTVSAPLTISTIAVAKTKADSSLVAISGRLTVTSQFGGRLIYVQDNTAGMAVFGATTTSFPASWQIGDSVTIAGTVVTFNGFKEIVNITQATLVSGQTNKPVSPIVITPDEQAAYEGSLVTINSLNFIRTGTFTNNTNYDVATCNNLYSIVRTNGGAANDIVGKEVPTNTRNITGVMGTFNGTPQLLPRFVTDITPVATNQCSIRGVCPTTELINDGTLDRNKTFDVAAWNIEWFGHPTLGPTNEQLQQDNVKCIIEKLKSDIIVLAEVCDTSKVRTIIPANYDYRCSAQYYSHFFDIPETAADPAQKVCVVYNKATVSPIEAECKAILTTNATFTASSPDNSFWASGRLPYMFTANVTVDGIARRMRVIGLHAKAGSAVADYNRRLADVQALKTELDTKYSKDLLIVAGDFNDDLDTSITVGQASSYANFVKDSANYRGLTKVLSDAKKRSTVSQTDMVDHILISNELYNAYENNTVDVATASSIGLIKAYGSATTDHYPVWARFNLGRTTNLKEVINWNTLEANTFPNPVNDNINIDLKSEILGEMEIQIVDILGHPLSISKQKVTIGSNFLNISTENLNNGIYMLVLKQGNKGKSVRFIKI